MPAIVVPEPQIPCADDPELERSGYPLSSLGENLKIVHAMKSCPCTKKCFWIYILFHLLFPLSPIICLVAYCYFHSNPEIQVSHHIIPGTLCPKCKTGPIKYSMIVDGSCACDNASARNKELFICENCQTVYPEFQLSKYFGPYPPFRRGRRD